MQYFLLIFMLCIGINSFAQDFCPQIQTNLDSTQLSFTIDSLRARYAFKKKIPKSYELEILLALSYFPELTNTRIKFKLAKIKTTLNARPTVGSLLFRRKKNRRYVVRINKTQRDSMVILNDVPFNAKIGLLGHEFCHFVDYEHKHLGGILNRLLSYLKPKSKEKFEKEIDHLTIERGLGWQLYAWSFFVLHDSKASEKYKAFKAQIYLEPEEIIKLIEANKAY